MLDRTGPVPFSSQEVSVDFDFDYLYYCNEVNVFSFFFLPSVLIEHLAGLFQQAGFETLVNEYVLRETVNKKEGLCVPRVFLQSKFRKPVPS